METGAEPAKSSSHTACTLPPPLGVPFPLKCGPLPIVKEGHARENTTLKTRTPPPRHILDNPPRLAGPEHGPTQDSKREVDERRR